MSKYILITDKNKEHQDLSGHDSWLWFRSFRRISLLLMMSNVSPVTGFKALILASESVRPEIVCTRDIRNVHSG